MSNTDAPVKILQHKPPFTYESAKSKVKNAQNMWNSKDPERIAQVYTEGQDQIKDFLTQKFKREQNYKLRKELFVWGEDKLAVQFWYEYQVVEGEDAGKWFRCYGLEDWTFAADGKMRKRQMSGNDLEIKPEERWFVDGVDINAVHIGEEHW